MVEFWGWSRGGGDDQARRGCADKVTELRVWALSCEVPCGFDGAAWEGQGQGRKGAAGLAGCKPGEGRIVAVSVCLVRRNGDLAMGKSLKEELQLIDEASAAAMADVTTKVIYHGVDWEIGVSVASSRDASPSGFVNLILSGTDQKGEIVTRSVKMSQSQFVDFYQQVQKMQRAIAF